MYNDENIHYLQHNVIFKCLYYFETAYNFYLALTQKICLSPPPVIKFWLPMYSSCKCLYQIFSDLCTLIVILYTIVYVMCVVICFIFCLEMYGRAGSLKQYCQRSHNYSSERKRIKLQLINSVVIIIYIYIHECGVNRLDATNCGRTVWSLYIMCVIHGEYV